MTTPSKDNGFEKHWIGQADMLAKDAPSMKAALINLTRPVFVVGHQGTVGVSQSGTMVWGRNGGQNQSFPLVGFAPPLSPADLGDAGFKSDLGIKYAYVVGAMANGITSVEMVRAAGEAGMVGFFGAGGLSLDLVEKAIIELLPFRDQFAFGFNLIHSPSDPQLEMAVAEMYLHHAIHLVSASAYLDLTLPLVYYRIKGIHRNSKGAIVCPNRVVAKVSRIEVAKKFFSPAPEKLLSLLVQQGKLSEKEVELAHHVPIAQDITAEADSGGHTDNRPAISLLPTFLALRDQSMNQYEFETPLRVGLAGGIATPDAVTAAFSMGAAYVLTGSINQAAVEADTSQAVRDMLAQAQQADVTMAPSADMFELGVKVQVLKRGTMFAMRAAKLYEIYRSYGCYEEIPDNLRNMIERDLLRTSFNEAWDQTRRFFTERDPRQISRAEKEPLHKMALVFRSYLGQTSLWAKQGLSDRKIDYQIWCGPAMGAFNTWAKGSCLEAVEERLTAHMGMNLMFGAAYLSRVQWLRSQAVKIPAAALSYQPLCIEDINRCISPGTFKKPV